MGRSDAVAAETGALLRYPFAGPFDLVLAADCVYDVELVGPCHGNSHEGL